jgi:hypothetical protein
MTIDGDRWLSAAFASAKSLPMTLRHAAALPLVVWYLMTPDYRNEMGRGEVVFLTKAPLSKWTLFEQYDTRAECENDIKERKKSLDQDVKQCPTFDCNISFARTTEGRCVASDDPRLKNNPSVRPSK